MPTRYLQPPKRLGKITTTPPPPFPKIGAQSVNFKHKKLFVLPCHSILENFVIDMCIHVVLKINQVIFTKLSFIKYNKGTMNPRDNKNDVN